MIGILIVAHGTLGESLIETASHVLGQRPPHLASFGVAIQDDPEQMLARAQGLVRRLDQGAGVLILADICGATPCNVARKLTAADSVACVAGVNLPMLVRALTYRNEPLATVVEKALSGGREGVMNMNGGAFCDVAAKR